MEGLPAGLQDLIVNGVSVGLVIFAIIEALKQARKLPADFAPLLALGIGVVFSLAQWLAPEPTAVVVRGLGVGAVTSLGYAGIKKAMTNSKPPLGSGVDG